MERSEARVTGAAHSTSLSGTLPREKTTSASSDKKDAKKEKKEKKDKKDKKEKAEKDNGKEEKKDKSTSKIEELTVCSKHNKKKVREERRS